MPGGTSTGTVTVRVRSRGLAAVKIAHYRQIRSRYGLAQIGTVNEPSTLGVAHRHTLPTVVNGSPVPLRPSKRISNGGRGEMWWWCCQPQFAFELGTAGLPPPPARAIYSLCH